jgi:hypothetical protein
LARKNSAAKPGGADVHPEMAESLQAAVSGDREKAPEPTAGDVLEEDALDRVLGAEGENLTERRRT